MTKPLVWTNCRVRLGELKPWESNPRKIGKEQSERLAQSFNEFSQVEVFAIGPSNQVYNGHQRLSMLLAKFGKDHSVDARRSSRALTEKERKKLTAFLHAGATGQWDWKALSGWDPIDLKAWGFDNDLLKNFKTDFVNLGDILNKKKKQPTDGIHSEVVCPKCGTKFFLNVHSHKSEKKPKKSSRQKKQTNTTGLVEFSSTTLVPDEAAPIYRGSKRT